MNGGADEKPVSGAFVAFCDQLLYANRVWKQERQIRELRASIRAIEKAKNSNAFKSFCDRLLLSNRIWQLEGQVQELAAEGERNKRTREAAVSRAAQQMAVDVRKEAMIEEFVMELIQELQESKEAICGLKETHEREIREVQGDWLKECRQLARENEQLRLERHARLMEQEISNEFEQSLWDAVEWSHRRIREFEDGDGDSTLVGDAFDHGSVLFSGSSWFVDGTEMDDLKVDDEMSTTSSATYVSLGGLPTWPRKRASLRCQRHRTVTSQKSQEVLVEKRRLARRESIPLRKLDTAPYAGFSFNPLFFGKPETLVVSPSRAESTDTPVKLTLKIGSPSSLTTRPRRESMTKLSKLVGPTGTRGHWRF